MSSGPYMRADPWDPFAFSDVVPGSWLGRLLLKLALTSDSNVEA